MTCLKIISGSRLNLVARANSLNNTTPTPIIDRVNSGLSLQNEYSIGIPTVLYKELLLIAEGKEENLLEKLLEKISSKETYLLDIVPDEALLWMV